MTRSNGADETITDELIAWARRRPELTQFLSRVGAHQYRRLYGLVHEYVPAGARVLDWGLGNGHFTYFLLRSGYDPTAFSVHPNDFARWVPEIERHFVGGDVGEPTVLPFEDESFGAVGSIGVLEHVRETEGDELGSLREIRRVLKPGGVFVCYHFPNRGSLIEKIASRVPAVFHHIYKYGEEDIRNLCRAADLDLVHQARYGVLPRTSARFWPPPLRYSRTMASWWDGIDGALGGALAGVAQNHCFVARKPGNAETAS